MRPKEPQPHSAMRKNFMSVMLSKIKPHTTEFILNNCIYIKFQQKKNKSMLLEVRRMVPPERRASTGKRGTSGERVTVLFLDSVVVIWECLFCDHSSDCTLRIWMFYFNYKVCLK